MIQSDAGSLTHCALVLISEYSLCFFSLKGQCQANSKCILTFNPRWFDICPFFKNKEVIYFLFLFYLKSKALWGGTHDCVGPPARIIHQ